MEIASRMGRKREGLDFSQDYVARKMGRTTRGARSAISRWEQGETLPDIADLLLYAQVIGTPIADLVDGVVTPTFEQLTNGLDRASAAEIKRLADFLKDRQPRDSSQADEERAS